MTRIILITALGRAIVEIVDYPQKWYLRMLQGGDLAKPGTESLHAFQRESMSVCDDDDSAKSEKTIIYAERSLKQYANERQSLVADVRRDQEHLSAMPSLPDELSEKYQREAIVDAQNRFHRGNR